MPRVVPSQVVKLIDQLFPQARTEIEGQYYALGREHFERVAAVLELVQQIPPELIVLDGNQYAEFMSGVAAIRIATQVWQAQHWPVTCIGGLRRHNPVTLIRQALEACLDEFPAVGTAELSFISDNDLRENLRRDIGAVNLALANGEWKAATVLSGSVIEALLLWALQQLASTVVHSAAKNLVANKTIKRRPSTNLDEWFLPELIEVAADLNVIKPDTAAQARLAKDYRNLIHPGRTQRLGQVCDRGTALAAVAALERVSSDLGR